MNPPSGRNLVVLALALGLVLLGSVLPLLAQKTGAPAALPEILEFHRKLCPVCLESGLSIQAVQERFPGQFTVREVYIDEHPAIFRRYQVAIVPTQVFLDASGKEVFRHEGVFKPQKLEQKLRQLQFVK